MRQIQIAIILFTLLFFSVLTSCNSKKSEQKISKDYFNGYNQAIDTLNRGCLYLKVKLENLQESSDTILSVRRYLGSDSTRLVVCNPTFGDQRCEDLVWNNEIVMGLVDGIKRLKNVAVIDFHQINDTNLVCNLYLYDKQKQLVMRWRAFQFYKYRIVTISGIISNDFQSIESYMDDKGKIEM